MKNICLVLIVCLFACKKKGTIIEEIPFEPCYYLENRDAPEGYSLTKLTEITDNVNLKMIQFLDDQTGYLLAGNNRGGYITVYKTMDQGNSWQNTDITILETPLSLFFLDKKEGFATHYGTNGDLVKTENGGNTWQATNFLNLKGNLSHLAQDDAGQLFAILDGLYVTPQIVRSKDQGATWELLFENLGIDYSLIRPAFHLVGDEIFVTIGDGKILKLDQEGTKVDSIETGLTRFWDIRFINSINIVVVGDSKVIKTSDGGDNWSEIHNSTARIIDFSTPDEGWMILNKSYCNTDVYAAKDVLAYTQNGGETWKESFETTNLMINFNGHHQFSNGERLLVFENELFVLKEE